MTLHVSRRMMLSAPGVGLGAAFLVLNRLYGSVAERFAGVTGGAAEYKPLTDYPAVVRAFEVGAVNSQVWTATVEAGELDVSDVVVLFETPGYADYHWLVRPDLDEKFGAGTQDKVAQMLFDLDINDPNDAEILELFGAESFIPTENSNYDQIEAVASEVGLLA